MNIHDVVSFSTLSPHRTVTFMRRYLLSLASALVGLFAITLSGDDVPKPRQVRLGEAPATESSSVPGSDRAPALGAGRRAFVDPKTGKLVSRRPGAAPAAVFP